MACEIGRMNPFRIEKRIGIRAPAERIWDVLTDFAYWDQWNPHETRVNINLGFGAPVQLLESVPGLEDREVEATLGEWEPNGQLVWLEKRGFLFRSTRYYEIEELEPGSCIVGNGFIFSGMRGEGFHDKHKHKLRSAAETIAERLKQRVEG